MIKTKFELDESMSKLLNNALHCYPYDAFGNDNVAKLELMVEVIKMDRPLAWINSKFLSSEELLVSQPNNVMWQVAVDARNWLDGELELADLFFPEITQNNLIENFSPNNGN